MTVTGAVAAEVRANAARNGLRQREIAVLLGLSQAQVSRKMSGIHGFTLDELYALADVFGCPVSDLLPPVDSTRARREVTKMNDNSTPAPTTNESGFHRWQARQGDDWRQQLQREEPQGHASITVKKVRGEDRYSVHLWGSFDVDARDIGGLAEALRLLQDFTTVDAPKRLLPPADNLRTPDG